MDSRQQRRARARCRQQQAGRLAVALVTLGQPPAGYDPTKHNYVKKQMAMLAEGLLQVRPGEAQNVEVAHDDDCAIFRGGYCGCDPDIRVRP
jgi:hypothetical protein